MDPKVRKAIYEELEHEIQFHVPHSQKQYRANVGEYLEFVGNRDWQDRTVLYNYIEKLRKSGLSRSTINYIVRGPIGSLFRSHGLRLPVKLAPVESGMLDISGRVSFSSDEIISLIQAAKHSDNPQWQNVMAVASIYGLRADEIRQLRKEDTHPKRGTLVIHTLKGGLKREHLVPEQIAKYVFGYGYLAFSTSELYSTFHSVANAAGVVLEQRKAFHAIRHGLATELVFGAGLDQMTVYQFLRWKGAGILAVYLTPYMPAIDTTVFAKHTFLPYWGDKK